MGCSVTTRRSGPGTSCTWRRSTHALAVGGKAAWQGPQVAGRCRTTASGWATRRRGLPRCPTCPPDGLLLLARRLLGLRASPSVDGGLLLLWLSLANRPSSSCTRATSACTCSCRLAVSVRKLPFSARKAAFSAARSSRVRVMSPVYQRPQPYLISYAADCGGVQAGLAGACQSNRGPARDRAAGS